jgi:methionyl aminopeptidase
MIILKTPEEIEVMREAGRLVARVLAALREAARPGVATSELDVLAERLIRDAGAVPAFKGYRGYPATVCVSINEQVVHGIPAARRLQDGDLVSLDVGAVIKGYYGDAAVSFVAGGRPTRLQADLLDAG